MNLKFAKRKRFQISQTDLIKTQLLQPDSLLPLVIQPAVEDLNLIAWVSNNQAWIESKLFKHGGLLLRNFKITEATEFEGLIEAIAGKLLNYSYRSTPRSQVKGKIYTSTEYPPSQSIPLHNEMAYTRQWPMKIGFFCAVAAEEGGETPIADSRKVFQNLNPEIKATFQQKQVLYVRNYGERLDLPWQEVFQTEDRTTVENYCHQAGIEYEWLDHDQLRTRQVCQAIATHPQTQETVWFNQAHLFHVSRLNTEVRKTLYSVFSEPELPRNVYYGDGSKIEDDVIDEITAVYQQEAITFPWQAGDILLLDNMLAAHGRKPFSGARQILVGMAESFTNP